MTAENVNPLERWGGVLAVFGTRVGWLEVALIAALALVPVVLALAIALFARLQRWLRDQDGSSR